MTSIGLNHGTCVLDTITTIKNSFQEIHFFTFTLIGMLHTHTHMVLVFISTLELKLTHLSKSLRIFVM